MLAPEPPWEAGIAAESSFACLQASSASTGKRAFASTSAACFAATSEAMVFERAMSSCGETAGVDGMLMELAVVIERVERVAQGAQAIERPIGSLLGQRISVRAVTGSVPLPMARRRGLSTTPSMI